MRLEDIMSTDLASARVDTPITEVAKLMAQWDVGCIPVVDNNNNLKGLITDRDIVIRAVAKDKDASIPVSSVMSEDIVVGSPEMDVHEAANLMAEEEIRRLPVVEETKLVGIVALGDLAVDTMYMDEAGQALTEISKSDRTLM